MPTNVQVLVYRGPILDYMKYRHTALFFTFTDESKTLLHIEGSPGDFQFNPLDDYDPDSSTHLVKRINVGEVPDLISQGSNRAVVSRTPLEKDLGWNCQTWVGDALERMVKSQYLTASERGAALDAMVIVLLEAKDEP